LRNIVLKTVGLVEPLRQALKPIESEIHAAFVYGSVAKGSDQAMSDIDLMVVSDTLSYRDVFGALDKVSRMLGRTVNPTVYSNAEFFETNADGQCIRQPGAGRTEGLGDRSGGTGNVLGKEAPDAKEFDGLVHSGLARLKDAANEANSLESRFDLAYGVSTIVYI
jgi:predicted nucleotidyltransferase